MTELLDAKGDKLVYLPIFCKNHNTCGNRIDTYVPETGDQLYLYLNGMFECGRCKIARWSRENKAFQKAFNK